MAIRGGSHVGQSPVAVVLARDQSTAACKRRLATPRCGGATIESHTGPHRSWSTAIAIARRVEVEQFVRN